MVRAAVLEEFTKPLSIKEVRDPTIGTGEVLVDVLATCVLPYAAKVFAGQRRYPLEPPVIPGVGARAAGALRRAARRQPAGRRDGSGQRRSTGNFGSAGVAVALAMGAATVVCPGRNEAVPRDLESRFGERIRPVVLTGDTDGDRASISRTRP